MDRCLTGGVLRDPAKQLGSQAAALSFVVSYLRDEVSNYEMKRIRSVTGLIGILVILGVIAALYGPASIASAVAAGLEAERDVRAGRLFLKGGGYPEPWIHEYEQLVSERYGVRFIGVGGCTMSPEERAATHAYNAIVLREIERRYGGDALERASRDARMKFDQANKTVEVHRSWP